MIRIDPFPHMTVGTILLCLWGLLVGSMVAVGEHPFGILLLLLILFTSLALVLNAGIAIREEFQSMFEEVQDG